MIIFQENTILRAEELNESFDSKADVTAMTSLSSSTSTGLSTARSSISSLSTSTSTGIVSLSTGLSTTNSAVSSLSTAVAASVGAETKLAIYNYNGAIDGNIIINTGSFSNFGALAGLIANITTSNLPVNLSLAGLFKLPAKSQRTMVTIRVVINGTIGGAPNTSREFFVQARRADGTTVILSKSTTKVDTNDISNREADLISYTAGLTDPFTVDGFLVGINNNSGQTITITTMSILILQIG